MKDEGKYFQLGFTHEELVELLEKINNSEVEGGIQGIQGPQGERGPVGPQGPKGDKGETGKDGINGKDFTFDMFTPEQLELLRGPQGEAGKDAENIELDLSTKMDVSNPTCSGSFSMNRYSGGWASENTIGDNSSTFGYRCKATKSCSFASGYYCDALGEYSHASGYYCDTEGQSSHAEGEHCKAIGKYSHVEGYYSTVEGQGAHAEGYSCDAEGQYSHAEGSNCTSSGKYSHAEGDTSYSVGDCSHTEGYHTSASGIGSHAEGRYCNAQGEYQHVQGKYNIPDDDNKFAHIVGNGTDYAIDYRSNAHTLDWDGNAWFQGDVFIKGTSQDDGQKLATEDMVIALQQEIAELRALIEELKNK